MSTEVIFVDTNLFLRYLTNDLPDQADLVEAALLRAAQGQIQLITTNLVVAEIVWTLESYYQIDKKEIQAMVLGILNTDGLEVINADLVLQAIVPYAEKNVDFIDAFNAAWMVKNNVDRIYTFDQRHFKRFEEIIAEPPN
jgi:predicted nucleic-acid-binding protein